MRAIYVVGLLSFNSLFGAVYPGQLSNRVEGTTVEGKTRATTGSPVELSNARYTLLRFLSEPKKLQLVSEAVTVRNVSGRRIRRLRLMFYLHHPRVSEDMCHASVSPKIAVDDLAAGETQDRVDDHIKMTWFAENNDLALTVLAVGAEFTDGSHWAAPRSERCPLTAECLSKRGPLMTRECSFGNDVYSFTLEVTDSKIVAYRLGVVSDTTASFEVRTGDWIELTDEQRVRGARLVDAGKSLSSTTVFPRLAYVKTVAGKQIDFLAGTSIFVAELRYEDGHIWRQDLSREALFWDN